ncbi:hypothetical protein PV516_18945 [Streptomyces scabiei]|uniref:hypothetical protein n=1 Tax=Streptomyces scabiei TaxID=1930 RepID=UPI0029A59F4B|nr:hypothetical protein [Streptomyces scabiei]MDX3165865.1 hypothetical protein [Streptomyces scabiei]
MSTPDFDMAPPAATATAPPPAAAPPPASGAAATTTPGKQRTQSRRSTSQKDDSLAGVLIPGGAITGLISLCWLIHEFGLPVVIFAILAAAATAATAVVIKVSRRAAQAASRRNRAGSGTGSGTGGGTGGGGSGGGRKGAGGGRSGGGLGGGNRSGGTGLRRSGGGSGSRGTNGPGGLHRKSSGGMGPKSPSANRSGGTGLSPRTNKGGLGGGRSTAGPKPMKGSLFGGSKGPGSKGLGGKGGLGSLGGGGGKNTPRGNLNGKGLGGGKGSAATGKSGKGLIEGLGDGSRALGKDAKALAGKIKDLGGKSKTPKGTGAGGSGKKAPGAPGKVTPTGKGKGSTGPGKGGSTGKGKGSGTPGKVAPTGKGKGSKGPGKKKSKVGKAKAPKHAGYTWKRNPIRKTKSVAGKVYRNVTSPKFRHRMHKAGTPFRAVFRGTRKHGGKLMANSMRWGGRLILWGNSVLGAVRYSTVGPNWLKPLSKVLFWATSPLAKLVNVSRSWTWLNTWIYTTATARPLPAPASAKRRTAAPTAGTGTAAPAPTSGAHAPVPSPATAGTAGGTPVNNAPVHHAYPLIYAADAIRMATAAFATAPADNMKGYEAVIENLGHLEFAMCSLLHDIAQVTEDDFKVNPEIPNQYRALGIHFLALGAFVDSAHRVFRTVHAEQLENIENPTWQGRKWDISENWAHIMPQFAWTDPTVHVVPLLLASGAIRDAGIHIRLHPSGTMFGYEMTIEHLAPLAEALYELMETVATVTEAEFSVHPGITAMHRDAGLRFRDLGGAITAVHFLYRLLHQEQLLNLENPSYQAAKWDQSRNT